MRIAMLLPALVFAAWLYAEVKEKSKRLRIILGVLSFILAAGVVFNLLFVWGYDEYHYRVSLTKIRTLIDADQLHTVTNALTVYEQAAQEERGPSFEASYKLNVALGTE